MCQIPCFIQHTPYITYPALCRTHVMCQMTSIYVACHLSYIAYHMPHIMSHRIVSRSEPGARPRDGGVYFVCVMKLHSELVFTKCYEFGRNLCFPLTPTIVPFSVDVLAVVTNKVETARWNQACTDEHMHRRVLFMHM